MDRQILSRIPTCCRLGTRLGHSCVEYYRDHFCRHSFENQIPSHLLQYNTRFNMLLFSCQLGIWDPYSKLAKSFPSNYRTAQMRLASAINHGMSDTRLSILAWSRKIIEQRISVFGWYCTPQQQIRWFGNMSLQCAISKLLTLLRYYVTAILFLLWLLAYSMLMFEANNRLIDDANPCIIAKPRSNLYLYFNSISQWFGDCFVSE